MTTIELLKELRKHRILSEKRSLMHGRNKASKIIVYALSIFFTIYLLAASIMLAFAVITEGIKALTLICTIFPIIMVIDFSFRFIMQQTPSQIIKPYLLLPIKKSICIDTFVFRSLYNAGNFIWFILVLPFVIMTMFFSGQLINGGLVLLLYLLGILINSQFYLIVRTLVNDSIIWWFLPISIFLVFTMPAYYTGVIDLNNLFLFYSSFGIGLFEDKWFYWLFPTTLLILLIQINRKLQLFYVMKEISRKKKEYNFHGKSLNKIIPQDSIGVFLNMEIISIQRNKNIRKGCIFAMLAAFMMSLICTFTDIYSSIYAAIYWCLYNYIIIGSIILTKMMCYEGNYIDTLLIRKESILTLLRAKYYFYSTLLLIPTVFMLVPVFMGKWSIEMLISCYIFTIGFQYFITFQLAVYNKNTIPLNCKLTSNHSLETNYYQILVELFTILTPATILGVTIFLFGEKIAWIVITIIGLLFITTHRLWLNNIYNRMMKRKYENIEGFRKSREQI